MLCGNPVVGVFISFSYGQLHLLVTYLHSYPHGSNSLLKFGIGVLLLEAEPGHIIIRPTSTVCCIILISVNMCVYSSFSMNILWYVVGRITKKTAFFVNVKTKAQISAFVFTTYIVQSSLLPISGFKPLAIF